jgi:hypothetical protein
MWLRSQWHTQHPQLDSRRGQISEILTMGVFFYKNMPPRASPSWSHFIRLLYHKYVYTIWFMQLEKHNL